MNLKLLLKVMTVAGPAIFKVIRKYGPQFREMYKNNPEMVKNITGKIQKITKAGKDESTPESMEERVEILLGQVTYLYASAKTPEVAKQARKWRAELAGIQMSIPLLAAMAKKNRKIEMRGLNERIDNLSAAIIAGSIADEVEDAEVENISEARSNNAYDGTEY